MGDGDGMVPEWTVGDRMRKALDGADLGVQEIADELGVTRSAVGKWLHGHVTPRRAVLMGWAQLTGVSLEWLETGDVPATDAGQDVDEDDDGGAGGEPPTDEDSPPAAWEPARPALGTYAERWLSYGGDPYARSLS